MKQGSRNGREGRGQMKRIMCISNHTISAQQTISAHAVHKFRLWEADYRLPCGFGASCKAARKGRLPGEWRPPSWARQRPLLENWPLGRQLILPLLPECSTACYMTVPKTGRASLSEGPLFFPFSLRGSWDPRATLPNVYVRAISSPRLPSCCLFGPHVQCLRKDRKWDYFLCSSQCVIVLFTIITHALLRHRN